MKQTVTKALIAAALLMLMNAPAYAQESVKIETEQSLGNKPYNKGSILTLKNNTGIMVAVSFVYFDPIDQCWVSRGWRQVPAYGSENINFGEYNGNVYIHGQHKDETEKLKWGKGYWFCVDRTDAFRILHAESATCESKREYSKIEMAPNTYKEYVFNPE